MTNFDEVMQEVYLQMANVKDSKKLPYYLFVSKPIYSILRDELCKDSKRFPYNKVEIFEDMEVVVLSDVPTTHIEVKGIVVKDARKG